MTYEDYSAEIAMLVAGLEEALAFDDREGDEEALIYLNELEALGLEPEAVLDLL